MTPRVFDLLTSLPTSVACSVLSEWSEPYWWTLLDSAYCNRGKREGLLDIFQSGEFVCEQRLEVSSSSSIAGWAILRKVKFSNVFCYWGFDESEGDESEGSEEPELTMDPKEQLRLYLQQFGKYVRVLRLPPEYGITEGCMHLRQLTCALSERTCQLISHNRHLRKLTLTGGPDDSHSSLDDALCDHLEGVNFSKLKELTINVDDTSDNKTPYRRCLVALFRTTKRLEELTIYGRYDSIETATWVSIAEQCSRLLRLSVSSTLVSDDAVAQITALCPQITSLSMLGNDAITDDGIRSILLNLRYIHYLDLEMCDSLTDKTIHHVVDHGANLKTVCLSSCEGISSSAIKTLRKSRGGMNVYD